MNNEQYVVLYSHPEFPGIYGPFASRQGAEDWLFRELLGMGLTGTTLTDLQADYVSERTTLAELQAEYAETDATGSGGYSATIQVLHRKG